MKNIIKFLAASLMIMSLTSAKAEIKYGLSIITGETNIDGTEAEGTAADTSTRTASFEEAFLGGDIFIESVDENGLAFGLAYVPLDIELGSGSRNDLDGDDAAENDNGNRTAKASVNDLLTFYTNLPVGDNGYYGLLGVHRATIKTEEVLNESSYGDEKIWGAQFGFGKRMGNLKMELSYSNFENITATATGGGTNSVSADADAMALRISYGF